MTHHFVTVIPDSANALIAQVKYDQQKDIYTSSKNSTSKEIFVKGKPAQSPSLSKFTTLSIYSLILVPAYTLLDQAIIYYWKKSINYTRNTNLTTTFLSFHDVIPSLVCVQLQRCSYSKIVIHLLMTSFSRATSVFFHLIENHVTEPPENFLGDCWLI